MWENLISFFVQNFTDFGTWHLIHILRISFKCTMVNDMCHRTVKFLKINSVVEPIQITGLNHKTILRKFSYNQST